MNDNSFKSIRHVCKDSISELCIDCREVITELLLLWCEKECWTEEETQFDEATASKLLMITESAAWTHIDHIQPCTTWFQVIASVVT